MDNNILLSICIGSYNRASYVLKLVEELLCSHRKDIEIVVNDNNSTDETYKLLCEINDSRLKVYVNENNIGGPKNFLQTVFRARGKYALYCNDRDWLYIDKIERLFDFLTVNDLACMYLTRNYRKTTGDIKIFDRGIEALCNMELKLHPTGFLFNTKILRENINKQKIMNIETLYPFEHLMIEIINYGKVALWDLGVYTQPQSNFFSNNKSGYCKKSIDLESMWFHPYYDIKLFREFINHIKNYYVQYNDDEIKKIAIAYAKTLSLRIWEYKRKMWSRSFVEHYSFKRKYISNCKMLRYVKKFFSDIKNISMEFGIDISNKDIKHIKFRTYKKTIIESLKCDINIMLRRVK